MMSVGRKPICRHGGRALRPRAARLGARDAIGIAGRGRRHGILKLVGAPKAAPLTGLMEDPEKVQKDDHGDRHASQPENDIA